MKRYIYLIFIAILSIGTIVTLHDMQVSTGIGLFFANSFGAADRRIFDLLADVLVLAVYGLLLYIPFRRALTQNTETAFRIQVSYLALMPAVSTVYLLELILNFGYIYFAEREALFVNIEALLADVSLVVPFAIIMAGLYRHVAHASFTGRHKAYAVLAAVLLLAGCVLPAWTDFLGFAACYLILLIALDFWQALKLANWPIYIVLLFRCIYNFYDILASYV